MPIGDGPLGASGDDAGDRDRWFAGLSDAARRAGIELGGAAVRDGVLTVEVGAPGDAPLRVDLLPRAPRDRYYLVTARFGLSGTLFFVQVYPIGSATSCLPYTVTFSN